MGQAKKRGTFEDRRQQSIAASKIRQAEADAESDRRYAERRRAAQAAWDAMTDDEKDAARDRAARRKSNMSVLAMLPLMMMAGAGFGYGRRSRM